MINFDYKYFSGVLGMSESSNNYSAVNGIAFGRYQFIPGTYNSVLDDLGLERVESYDFLENHSLQETVFRGYVNIILRFVHSHYLLANYLGNTIEGKSNHITTKINIYGLVAGAWLGGEIGLKEYLEAGEDKEDFNGTHISDYIAKFSDDWNKKKDLS